MTQSRLLQLLECVLGVTAVVLCSLLTAQCCAAVCRADTADLTEAQGGQEGGRETGERRGEDRREEKRSG